MATPDRGTTLGTAVDRHVRLGTGYARGAGRTVPRENPCSAVMASGPPRGSDLLPWTCLTYGHVSPG